MAQVALKLRDKSLDDKLTLNSTVVESMTGNANFATPNPPLVDLTGAADDIVAKRAEVAAAETELATRMSELETLVEKLVQLLTQEASYVQNITLGDEAKILSAGMPVKGQSAPVGPLPAPGNLRITGGDLDGTIDCMWNPVSGRDTYIAEHATAVGGPWTQFYVSKKSSATASGLVSGQAYYVRVRAVGAAGPGPWSDIAQGRAT